jgi:hypothetical protein
VKRELRLFDETLGIGVYKVFRIGKVATEGEILPSCIDMCVL